MNYVFIINPISGSRAKTTAYEKAIRETFHSKKIPMTIYQSQRRGHATEMARQHAGPDTTVVAVGGDGTVNEVGAGLLGSSATLAILPKGSGNGLATELRISTNPIKACGYLFNAKTIEMDAGRLNEHLFFNVAGVGLDARVAHDFDQWDARSGHRRGLLPYIYLTLKELFFYKMPSFELIADGQSRIVKPLLAAVAIGKQYGVGAIVAPKARINDGLFHVTLVHEAPALQILRYLPRLPLGTLDTCPFVETITAATVKIRLPRPLAYHLDGEPHLDTTKLEFSILPKAMKLLVPTSYRP